MKNGTHPVRQWRKQRGMPLSELAAEAKTVKSHLCNIENGKADASLKLIRRLSDITGIPIRKIAEYAGTPA